MKQNTIHFLLNAGWNVIKNIEKRQPYAWLIKCVLQTLSIFCPKSLNLSALSAETLSPHMKGFFETIYNNVKSKKDFLQT